MAVTVERTYYMATERAPGGIIRWVIYCDKVGLGDNSAVIRARAFALPVQGQLVIRALSVRWNADTSGPGIKLSASCYMRPGNGNTETVLFTTLSDATETLTERHECCIPLPPELSSMDQSAIVLQFGIVAALATADDLYITIEGELIPIPIDDDRAPPTAVTLDGWTSPLRRVPRV